MTALTNPPVLRISIIILVLVMIRGISRDERHLGLLPHIRRLLAILLLAIMSFTSLMRIMRILSSKCVKHGMVSVAKIQTVTSRAGTCFLAQRSFCRMRLVVMVLPRVIPLSR
jgi:hypothetical protein